MVIDAPGVSGMIILLVDGCSAIAYESENNSRLMDKRYIKLLIIIFEKY